MYLYIETSVPRIRGEKAILISNLFNKTTASGKCFTFWYHMYGIDIGELNIYVNRTNAKTGKEVLWSLIGNQGNRWFNGTVNLGIVNDTYQVTLLSSCCFMLFHGA